jgi:HlyD family secretion protein
MKSVLSLSLISAILIGTIATVSVGGKKIFEPLPMLVQGEVDARQVDIAPKVAGRIEELRVKEGDPVKQGDILALLTTPEIEAKAQQASGVQQAATAQREKSDNGARKQEIEAARRNYETTKAVEELSKKTYERVSKLYENGHAQAQLLDEAMTKWKASMQMTQAAYQIYDMAMTGAREEDKKAAQGIEKQAGGLIAEVESYLGEREMKAQVSGEISDIIADPGELVTPGFPVFTIVDLSDVWIVLNLREDLLKNVRMGTVFKAKFPALDGQEVELKVDYIKALGDYATWRATKTTGDFDMKTFEIHARPTQKVEGLRPGMTALVKWDEVRPENGSPATPAENGANGQS